MKYIKLGMVLCTLMALLPFMLSAQTNTKINVKAIVRSSDGSPIEGAVVRSEQDNISAMADSLGIITLEVSPSATLAVSAEGFETRFDTASPEMQEFVLNPDKLTETVELGFRTVEKKDVLGAVSNININELLNKNYITYSLEDLEALVPGFNGNSIWGYSDYLVFVDGVPRDLGSIMPTEIEEITFLKGISAVALYGSRAANGVVLITTKRGIEGQQTVNVRANAGLFVPKRFPKYLGSAEYMSLYNEARENDGLEPLFSDERIYNSAIGANPYRYPNVDYYSPEYLQDSYSRYDATMEITGGNDQAKYYTNMGFWKEGSLLDFGQAQQNTTERFHIRGNVDVKLNKFLTAQVDAAAAFINAKGVNADYWGGAATLRPNRFAPLIPIDMLEENDEASLVLVRNTDNLIDGRYVLGGTQLDQTNPFAGIYAGGSRTGTDRLFQFNTKVNADLSNVLEGLSFSSLFGIDYATAYITAFQNQYAVFSPSWTNYAGTDMIGGLTMFGQDAATGEQNIVGNSYRQTLSFSGQFNYKTRVNDQHNVSAILLAQGFQRSQSTVYHSLGNANLGLYLGYDYKNKYYADFNGALIHSARLPENNRQAFSPTLSLGWRISEEEFLANSSVVDNLKLTVNAGVLHTDIGIDGFYLYDINYDKINSGYYGWNDGTGLPSTDSRRSPNPDLTFSKREEINIGLDASLFNNFLGISGNYFVSNMTGIVGQYGNLYPNYFENNFPESSFLPFINYNNDQRSGFDFNVNLNQKIGQVDWTLGVNGMYYTTQALKRAEINEYDYQTRQGQPLDAVWGLESDGLFQPGEIEGAPRSVFGAVKPGDIKYIDQNADGVINEQDEVYLGRGGWFGSPLTMGAHLTAKWKNLTFFVLGVARSGAIGMRSNNYFWVNGEDKYSEVVRGRWTEETMDTATYPRLTTLSGNNNFRASDYWTYSTNRFDLARVQISYALPDQLFGNGFVRGLDVYVNGSDLLTIAPNREILELNIGGSPQTRFFNLGLRAQF